MIALELILENCSQLILWLEGQVQHIYLPGKNFNFFVPVVVKNVVVICVCITRSLKQ